MTAYESHGTGRTEDRRNRGNGGAGFGRAPGAAGGHECPPLDHLLEELTSQGDSSPGGRARGDVAVDYHHVVEDVGLVLGEALRRTVEDHGAVQRFGLAVIPMDEALSEVAIDVCGRPTAVVQARFPQQIIGEAFSVGLVREFLVALASRAGMSLHAHVRYGENSHHMVESLFKALGKAVAQAYCPVKGSAAEMSTKRALFT